MAAQSFFSSIPKPSSIFTTSPTPSCTFIFLISLCILSFFTFHHPKNPTTTAQQQLFPSPNLNNNHNHLFHKTFISSASNFTVSNYLRHLTAHPHIAGTKLSLSTSSYVFEHFQSLHLPTHIDSYSTLLSYPLHSSLSAHFSNTTSVRFPVSEPGSSQNGVVSPYHAYSPSGSAYGPAVFVNYGRDEDYSALLSQEVEVKGCVAVVRRGGGLSRNAAVQIAAGKGVAAVLMYTEVEESGGSRVGVERGTVMKGLGDPLSPDWAAVDGGERLRLEDSEVAKRFPAVPSMPISEETAWTILKGLEGGRVPYQWKGTLKSKVERVGPGPTMLNFTYQGEDKMAKIHNVFAVIRGSEEVDRYVLVGNHRDAWTYGAVDPNSGTAALLDIARRYALLMRLGWTPRRTIILSSWDAEEFGMIGSTEWVEQNLVNLQSKAVAYLNVDCAVQGPGFFPSATPQLDDLLVDVVKKVKDPDSADLTATVYEKWTATNAGINIQRLSGVDSDFAPFLHHGGIPSVDLYYGKDFPVYHTAFDSYSWMANFGDPLFHRHVAVTGIWGLLALHLADDSILPFNYLSYAAQLKEYTFVLRSLLEERISLHPITAAIEELEAAAKEVEEEAKKLREEETKSGVSVLKKRALNDRLMLAERGFLDSDGLQGRPWFKHLVYGPHSDHIKNTKLVFFPGIVDAIYQSTPPNDKENNNNTQREKAIRHEIWRVARAIQRAAYALKGQLVIT